MKMAVDKAANSRCNYATNKGSNKGNKQGHGFYSPNVEAEKRRLASFASRPARLSQADCWASNVLP